LDAARFVKGVYQIRLVTDDGVSVKDPTLIIVRRCCAKICPISRQKFMTKSLPGRLLASLLLVGPFDATVRRPTPDPVADTDPFPKPPIL
jgi:hypothetical protein